MSKQLGDQILRLAILPKGSVAALPCASQDSSPYPSSLYVPSQKKRQRLCAP